MAWKVINLPNLPTLDHEGGKRILYSSESFHMWLHTDDPGTLRGTVLEDGTQEFHRHYADEMFYCLQGELTIRFAEPDGIEVVPVGAFVVVPAGQLYSLENTSTDTMILLGSRAEAHDVPRAGDHGEPIETEVHEWAIEQTEAEREAGASRPKWGASV